MRASLKQPEPRRRDLEADHENKMQGNERKRKQMSFHFLSLIFGIRTFQRVTADSNKKNFSPVPRRREGCPRPQHWPPKAASGSAAIGKSIAQDSDFRNTTSPAPCRPNRRQGKNHSPPR